MINLVTTGSSLQIVTNAAVQVQVVASFRDRLNGTDIPGSQETNISTATTTTIVSAPSGSNLRMVDDIQIIVIGSGAQDVRIEKLVTATPFRLYDVLLQTGQRIAYTNDQGFRRFDAIGQEILSRGATGLSITKITVYTGSGQTGTHVFAPDSVACLIEGWGAGAASIGGVALAANVVAVSGAGAGAHFLVGLGQPYNVPTLPVSIPFQVGRGGVPIPTGVASPGIGPNGGNTVIGIQGVTGPVAANLIAQGGFGGTSMTTGNGLEAAPGGLGGALNIPSGYSCIENNAGMGGGMGLRLSGTIGIGGQGGYGPPGNRNGPPLTGPIGPGVGAPGGAVVAGVLQGITGAPGALIISELARS